MKRIFCMLLCLILLENILPDRTDLFQTHAKAADVLRITGDTVSACDSHVLAVKDDGTLWSWGRNYEGQLGLGTNTVFESKPHKIMEQAACVFTDENNGSYAIKQDGTLYAWGRNIFDNPDFGQYDNYSNTPVKIADQVVQISSGIFLKNDGTAWRFGHNDILSHAGKPVKITDGVRFVSGSTDLFLIKEDGTLWMCGPNYKNLALGKALGKKGVEACLYYVADGVKCVVQDNYNVYIIKNDDTLWGCGSNMEGILEKSVSSSDTDKIKFQFIAKDVKKVVPAYNHILILTQENIMYMKGYNDTYGPIPGDSTLKSVKLTQLKNGVSDIAGGRATRFYVDMDGKLFGWGYSYYGLINKSIESVPYPEFIMDHLAAGPAAGDRAPASGGLSAAEFEAIMIDAVKRYTSGSDRWNYNSLINNELYTSFQFREYLDDNAAARLTLWGSALIYNDEIMDYALGGHPEKGKYKTMLKDFIKGTEQSVEALAYAKNIRSLLSDSLSSAQDIIEKDELVKLYCELENSTSRSSLESVIFKALDKPAFKKEEGQYVFRSDILKALDIAGTVLNITGDTLDGIMEVVDSLSRVELFIHYKEFLETICSYQENGSYLMPAAFRMAADELCREMSSRLEAVTGSLTGLAKRYSKTGAGITIGATELLTKGLTGSVMAGISIGSVLGNVFLGMADLINSAAYVEGYAYLGELYSHILKNDKERFQQKADIQNAEQFITDYKILNQIRLKGEETYLMMAGFKGDRNKEYLRILTGFGEKEKFCRTNIEMLQDMKFLLNI